jgi:CRISPR/Cas system-associated exonuclease Cas4 (RecB family)
MNSAPTVQVVQSTSAAARLAAADAFLLDLPAHVPVTIVGATRAAADDCARRAARQRPATIGMTRTTLVQLAARAAMPALALGCNVPGAAVGTEAVATRAAFEAARESRLAYFAPVAGMPGFPRVLAQTIQELRQAGIDHDRLRGVSVSGADLVTLLDRFEQVLGEAGAVDRAGLFEAAAATFRATNARGAVLLLDVPIETLVEQRFVAAVLAGATAWMATVSPGDHAAMQALVNLGGIVVPDADEASTDLARVRRFLFTSSVPPRQREPDGSVELFSAPGEARECIEIARRMLAHARDGISFDEMAVIVRSPHNYFGLIEHALHRAGIPAWFERGITRPHPAGRALLALLACRAENLSASRFAEYLSLAQVPLAPEETGPVWLGPGDAALQRTPPDDNAREDDAAAEAPRPADRADTGIVAGTLQAPWRWEALLGEAAVIGQDAARWERRLDGLSRELSRRIDEAARQDGDESGRVHGLRMTREQLEHLRAFALPVVHRLASWPNEASWGEWLGHLESLVPQVLRTPDQVLRVLADLRPMAAVGPVDLDEVRRVLSPRLATLSPEPPLSRFGRAFVGTPQGVRGRSFRVVFAPGLAERLFPQKAREDPLLLDADRRRLGALALQEDRIAREKSLLQLTVGAAGERLHASYPRIELGEARERVPSLYLLEVVRAASGRLPDHEQLQEAARAAGAATLGWPAPLRPEDALDDQEHDLSVLRALLDEPERARVRGHAHYLLGLSEHLRRSMIGRWARGQVRWSPHDGLIRVTERTAPALDAQRLVSRPYSLSAIQRYSACPYQFVLSAFYRLQPLERPEPLQRMDPLTRGSLFHEMQRRFFEAMRQRALLPVDGAHLEEARQLLEEAIADVARAARDELAPAVDRIWEEEVAAIARDLLGLLQHLPLDGEHWTPTHFEFAFGAVPGRRDPGSRSADVVLDGGFRLRGAVDLIEQHQETRALRVTDHKTGRPPDRIDRMVIGGGAVLQPVLYAAAVEAALGRPVAEGRLFYCTSAGAFLQHAIPFNERNKAAGLEVLQIVDRAVASGFLAAAPTNEACRWCDFVAVCGPDVPRRVGRKPHDPLRDLEQLRSRL